MRIFENDNMERQNNGQLACFLRSEGLGDRPISLLWNALLRRLNLVLQSAIAAKS
jgi:hypothetical protein